MPIISQKNKKKTDFLLFGFATEAAPVLHTEGAQGLKRRKNRRSMRCFSSCAKFSEIGMNGPRQDFVKRLAGSYGRWF
jgi:hypothetical protein